MNKNSVLAKCGFCKATGRDPNALIHIRPCPECKGVGVLKIYTGDMVRKFKVKKEVKKK